jgi:uncharacterized protein YciI
MFIILLTYKTSLPEVDKYLQAHREFLDYHYKQGLLVASGSMKPRTGGVIIAATKDKSLLEAIFKNDPYYLAEIADYQFIEFTPVMHCEELKELVLKTEGKLC